MPRNCYIYGDEISKKFNKLCLLDTAAQTEGQRKNSLLSTNTVCGARGYGVGVWKQNKTKKKIQMPIPYGTH